MFPSQGGVYNLEVHRLASSRKRPQGHLWMHRQWVGLSQSQNQQSQSESLARRGTLRDPRTRRLCPKWYKTTIGPRSLWSESRGKESFLHSVKTTTFWEDQTFSIGRHTEIWETSWHRQNRVSCNNDLWTTWKWTRKPVIRRRWWTTAAWMWQTTTTCWTLTTRVSVRFRLSVRSCQTISWPRGGSLVWSEGKRTSTRLVWSLHTMAKRTHRFGHIKCVQMRVSRLWERSITRISKLTQGIFRTRRWVVLRTQSRVSQRKSRSQLALLLQLLPL